MNFEPLTSTAPSRSRRSPAIIVIYLLEFACVGLLLYSLRTLAQPSWAAQKVATLQVEATREAETSRVSTSSASTDNIPNTNVSAGGSVVPKTQGIAEVEMVLSSVFGQLPTVATAVAKAGYPISNDLVDLGRMLYYDPRLSMNGKISCNNCHKLDNYGVDGLARSLGMGDKPVDRNSPTVYNAALHFAQFWDGRSPNVEDQATKPIMAVGEMGMVDIAAVKESLSTLPAYEAMFKTAFPNDPDPINLKNIGIAIGAFERGLITPSRFDRFLAGDRTQLSEQEQRGLVSFVSLRCPTCHMAETIGGQAYKRLGEKEPYPTKDLGRYTITKKDEDKYLFKVPSLRNIAKTAPYLHDGSIETLDEMVRLMARYQLGKEVTDEQVEDVISFLNTLTGDIPEKYIQPPQLPTEIELAASSDQISSDQTSVDQALDEHIFSDQTISETLELTQDSGETK